MNNYQVISISKSERSNGDNGYKIIEVNVSNPSESLYAVCTPVKIK